MRMSVVLDIKSEVKSTGSGDWLKARKRNVEENGGRGHHLGGERKKQARGEKAPLGFWVR